MIALVEKDESVLVIADELIEKWKGLWHAGSPRKNGAEG
jgi:hypothetical protein